MHFELSRWFLVRIFWVLVGLRMLVGAMTVLSCVCVVAILWYMASVVLDFVHFVFDKAKPSLAGPSPRRWELSSGCTRLKARVSPEQFHTDTSE